MSTYPHFPLQSADVDTVTINTLDTLPLKMPGAIASRDLLRGLVFAAASRLSGHQACDPRERAPSGPTVRGHLASQVRDLEALEGHLTALLAQLLPKGLGKRGRRVAIDVVALPDHGTVDEAHPGEVCRRTAQGGTTPFFPSATAYAVVRGRRYTLAMCRVRAKQRLDHVLRTLLARVVTGGRRIKLLLRDRGFSSVRGIQDLLTGAGPFSMPAGKRGTKSTPAGGPTGTYAWAAEQPSHWTPYTLKRATAGQVAFALAVVGHNTRGQRGRHQREALVDATWGVTHRPLRWMRATSRSRVGLESSYRQSQQARMRPSRRKPALRRLLMGVALGLRKVWGWVHAEVMAQPQRGARQLRPPWLRFARLLMGLLMEIARPDRLLRKIRVYHDLDEKAQAFGIVFNY